MLILTELVSIKAFMLEDVKGLFCQHRYAAMLSMTAWPFSHKLATCCPKYAPDKGLNWTTCHLWHRGLQVRAGDDTNQDCP